MTLASEVWLDRLATFIAELMPQWPVVGGALTVTDRDGTVEGLGFGQADRERGVAASVDHVFQVGSISKMFVSVVANQLIDEGRLSLDEPISDILPWVLLPGGEVTVRALLSHTGGLVLGGDGVPDDLAQLWNLRHLDRSEQPAEHFHYSNVGFMLLGRAIEARAGVSLAEVLSARVFRPLGMVSSLGRMRQGDRARMATGYWPLRDDVAWAPGDEVVPAAWFDIDAADGNVASTASDMARFARELIGAGSVVSAESMKRMMESLAPGGEDVVCLRGAAPVTSSRYGLGVNIEEVGGNLCLTHGGGMVGFQSFMIADRTAGVGITVLTNANGCYPIAQVIARAAHHLMTTEGRGELPAPDRCVDTGHDAPWETDRWLGDFHSHSGPVPLVQFGRDAAGSLCIAADGVVAPIAQEWTGRFVTSHASLREFRWDAFTDADGEAWLYGPHVYRPYNDAIQSVAMGGSDGRSVVGRYRSYSPWYPTFRVYERMGRLFLTAPGGVEAPPRDEELVRIKGEWRIGADEWLPERIRSGPVIDGLAVSLFRDGVEYSRLRD